MKTSIIEVSDMLSVLTVEDVEKRFCEVPGVGSATVNFAAGNATVRYDETLLEVADIRVLVHQRGQQSAGDSPPNNESVDKPVHKHGVDPMPQAKPAPAPAPAPAPTHAPAAPKTAMPPAPGPGPAVEAGEVKPAPGAPPSPAAAAHRD